MGAGGLIGRHGPRRRRLRPHRPRERNLRAGEGTAIRFCVLASGSKGNALWIEAEGRAVLVDCGLSGKEFVRRVNAAGLDPRRLEAVIVSHEHRDHVSGAGVIARKFNVPVHVNHDTITRAEGIGRIEPRIFKTGTAWEIGGLMVRSFSIPHDTADPVGFTFEHQGKKLGLATDLGTATNLLRERLAGCRALILEANHDYDMLVNGPYPWYLKQRVKSRRGHLSNEDSAELLSVLAHRQLKTVVLAHLSEVNNHPDLALEYFRSRFGPDGFEIMAAGQYEPGPVVKV